MSRLAEAYGLNAAITLDDARLFLASAGDERGSLGTFEAALTDALWKADRENLDRLAKGFPGLVAALRAYRSQPGGHAALRAYITPPPFPGKTTEKDTP